MQKNSNEHEKINAENSVSGSSPITGATLGLPRFYYNTWGDLYTAAWADDGYLYFAEDDSRGWNYPQSHNQTCLCLSRVWGDDPMDLKGELVNPMYEYDGEPEKNNNWKATGCTCIDGVIYMFVHRCKFGSVTPTGRNYARNCSLIKSEDYGKTWSETATGENPMFPGHRFGAPMFVQYGNNYMDTAHNADKYVYAVSNDGYWNNGDNQILGRVKREFIGRLDPDNWEFYTGGDGMLDENWSKDMYRARPVLWAADEMSEASVQYIKPLNRYVMTVFHQLLASSGDFTCAIWDFYEASFPWGPWTKFYSRAFDPEGYYNPVILPNFISEDGLSMYIVTSGDCSQIMRPGFSDNEDFLYRFTVMPLKLSTIPVCLGLINNGGFETGDLQCWTVEGNVRLVIDKDSGSFNAEAAGAGSLIYQEITGLKPDTVYELNVEAVAAEGVSASIGVRDYGNLEKVVSIPAETSEKLSLTFTTGYAHSSAQIFAGIESGEGAAVFKNFYIRETGPSNHHIINPDFEAGYRGWSGAEVSFTLRREYVYNGRYSARISVNNSPTSQKLRNLKPHTQYSLKAWCRVSDENNHMELGVRNFYNGFGCIPLTVEATEYTQVVIDFLTGDKPDKTEVFFMKTQGKGHAFADAFEIVEIKSGEEKDDSNNSICSDGQGPDFTRGPR